MVPENVYTYDVVSFSFVRFIHVANYKNVEWEPFPTNWLGRQNLKTHRVQVSPK